MATTTRRQALQHQMDMAGLKPPRGRSKTVSELPISPQGSPRDSPRGSPRGLAGRKQPLAAAHLKLKRKYSAPPIFPPTAPAAVLPDAAMSSSLGSSSWSSAGSGSSSSLFGGGLPSATSSGIGSAGSGSWKGSQRCLDQLQRELRDSLDDAEKLMEHTLVRTYVRKYGPMHVKQHANFSKLTDILVKFIRHVARCMHEFTGSCASCKKKTH